jgi:hypothetical protein
MMMMIIIIMILHVKKKKKTVLGVVGLFNYFIIIIFDFLFKIL